MTTKKNIENIFKKLCITARQLPKFKTKQYLQAFSNFIH